MGFFAKLSRYVDDYLLLPEEARERAEQAKALLAADDPAGALGHASAALDLRPDHPELLTITADALNRLGERKEAERLYREALFIDKEHASSRVGLARLLRETGRLSEAAEELRHAVPLLVGAGEPEEAAEALEALAYCHLELDRPDRAIRELRKAIALGRSGARAHRLLASLLLRTGAEPSTTRTVIRKAIEEVSASDDGRLVSEVGQVALESGLYDEAAELMRRALELGERAHLDLGRALAAQGKAMEAHEHALRAMEDEPGSPAPHELRAQLALRAGDRHGALGAYEAAISLGLDDTQALRRALETAAQVDLERAGALARRLAERTETDPLVVAVEARAALAAGGDVERAAQVLEVARESDSGLADIWLGLAEVAVARAQGESALEALERVEAIAPERAELEGLTARACRLVASSGSDQEPGLYDVLEKVHGLLVQRPELSEFAVDVSRIREDYDKPLLLTVMGEFNAGKSTFINAIVGEPVAPMGITPTTATINVLKFGPERKVRVLHRSGTIKELEYDALGAWLKGLSREAAVEVRQVEILYPAEELTRVNLVDTPGFNSIVSEHEKVAREFIERADAVVWLFDAGQPGKESEREALSRVTTSGKKILGVLNKADRLDDAAMSRVLEHLAGDELSSIVEEVVPLSARRALLAKDGDDVDEEALEASGLPELQRRLEAVFYSQARSIKRVGSAKRLIDVLGQAVAADTAANASLRRASALVDEARQSVLELTEGIAERGATLVVEELERIWTAVASEAAVEVLEFVSPRKHLLDSHRFSPEDREFLTRLIEERLSEAISGLTVQLAELAASALNGLWSEEELGSVSFLGGRSEGLDFGENVGRAMLAFHFGVLRGGRTDHFFDDVLPRIDLEESALVHRIERWWRPADEHAQREVAHAAVELARRLDARFTAESERLRAELARRRRAGARPLSGFASLAREWVDEER